MLPLTQTPMYHISCAFSHRRADNSLSIFKPLIDVGTDENCGNHDTVRMTASRGRGKPRYEEKDCGERGDFKSRQCQRMLATPRNKLGCASEHVPTYRWLFGRVVRIAEDKFDI